jgi:L-glutamine:2-deoxy-scyllo-inosose/3-amino-2,3-dideoxy-scyllo-inosose aminotransferase
MLAIQGGEPVRNTSKNPWPSWPIWGREEREKMMESLESGHWSYNGPMEGAFIEAWKAYTGSQFALLTANGTVSLQLALEALDIGRGDEVIVPAITWQATAAAVIDINAVPILVDVVEDSWCIDPEKAKAAVTSRTRAIIPVHLYGNMADMDALIDLSESNNIPLVEDAAHKHGGEWKGRKAGTLGIVGSFSLQLSKVLTAGEGGILTTSDEKIWERLDALRNCGRRPNLKVDDAGGGNYGLEGNFLQSGNYRITEFQAAVLYAQLGRLEEQNCLRRQNAEYLDSLIELIPGIKPMRRDPRETARVYFNYAFRYDPDEWGLSAAIFRKALAAELGVPIQPCYQPLTDCTLYRPRTKKRHRIDEEYWKAIDPSRFQVPVSDKVYKHQSVTLAHRLLLAPRKDMEQIAEAVRRIASEKSSLT